MQLLWLSAITLTLMLKLCINCTQRPARFVLAALAGLLG